MRSEAELASGGGEPRTLGRLVSSGGLDVWLRPLPARLGKTTFYFCFKAGTASAKARSAHAKAGQGGAGGGITLASCGLHGSPRSRLPGIVSGGALQLLGFASGNKRNVHLTTGQEALWAASQKPVSGAGFFS